VQPRLLIITASTGNGHISAAKALQAMAEGMGLECRVEDALDFTPKAFRSWFAGGYERLVHFSPALWGHLYRTSDRPLFNYQVQTALDYLNCAKLGQYLRDYKPDWVICTHSVAQPRLAQFREAIGFKMAVVVTDIHPHRMWLRGRPDFFFMPNRESLDRLSHRRPKFAQKAMVSGMPVHQVFVDAAHEGHEGKTVLVTSGGIGGGPFLEVVEALSELQAKVQVVSGRNLQVKESLQARFASKENVEILGYVPLEQMAVLMSSCDLMVAKPGGLTTFEALVCGTPMVIYRPFLIPGQEEDNAKYLKSIGAGVEADDLEGLRSTVGDLLANDQRRADMRAAARAHGQPDACRTIITKILALHERQADASASSKSFSGAYP
jgi:processive 1,2-diacylglycerol beta-glucosyltransferase